MAGGDHLVLDLQVARHALLGAQQEVLGVVHADLHRLLVRPPLLGVGLQPLLGGAVAAVAVHALGDVELGPAQLGLDVDRVADQALAGRLCLAES